MPSIQDWAAEAARRILQEMSSDFVAVTTMSQLPTEERIAAIIATFAEPLMKLLRESRRSHYHCDDSWYCCPQCVSSDHGPSEPLRACDCGADAWNAKVDDVVRLASRAADGSPRR